MRSFSTSAYPPSQIPNTLPQTNPNPPLTPNSFIPDRTNPYNNLNSLSIPYDKSIQNKYTLECWNCKSPIYIEQHCQQFECGNCHRMNKMPQKLINEIYFSQKLKNYRYNSYKNHLDMVLPLPYVIVVCPFCKGENRVQNGKKVMICFICGRGISVDTNEERVQKGDMVSLNPNSKYYRFEQGKLNRMVPYPNVVASVNKIFFPEPICYGNEGYYNYNRSPWSVNDKMKSYENLFFMK